MIDRWYDIDRCSLCALCSFPLTAISAIASVDTAAQIIPALGRYLAAHPSVSTNLQNLVPVILVGLISLAVCPILLAISNHESHIVTGYGVHDATLARYWKYLVFNVLIVFCVGRTAVQGYVLAKINATEVLSQVASSFPAAAPYFAGAIMYNTVIQCALELLRLGVSADVNSCRQFTDLGTISFPSSAIPFRSDQL